MNSPAANLPAVPTEMSAKDDQESKPRPRLLALVLLLPCVALLGTAAWLSPSPDGMGTHTQLGLPECGFKLGTGVPCPTCGMTTSFAHAASADLFAAFATQPLGALLALGTAMLLVASLWSLVTGMNLAPLGRAFSDRRAFLGIGALILLAWGYTVLRHLM